MNDLSTEVHNEFWSDVRKIQHETPFTLVKVEYDAGRDRGDDGDRSWFDITSLIVCGQDKAEELKRKLKQNLGPDRGLVAWKTIEGVIETAMRGEA